MYFKDESRIPEDPPDPQPSGEEDKSYPVDPPDTGSGGDSWTEPEIYTDPEFLPEPPTGGQ